MPETFSFAFLTALILTTTLRLWLARRQIRHVLAARGTVPPRFANRVEPDAHAKAADYTVAKTGLAMIAVVADVALVLGLTLFGGLKLIHDVMAPHADGIALDVLIIGSVIFLNTVVDLPFAAFRQFVIETRFGFNKMTVGLFVVDLFKRISIAAILGVPALVFALWLMSRMGPSWWLWVWLFWVGYSLFLVWAYPAWIAPVFNKFIPLADASLRHRVERLLERCGFLASGLFIMDGSRRSSHGNAYFTGFGKQKRIVFFDTLIERLAPEEIEAVLAHELGHFKRRHVIKGIALNFALGLVFLWVLASLMRSPWFFAGLGVEASTPGTGLTLFLLVAPAFTFPFSWCFSFLSRKHEFEADAYAARYASGSALVTALVKLYVDNATTLTPDPWYSRFHDSHPTATERISRLETVCGG